MFKKVPEYSDLYEKRQDKTRQKLPYTSRREGVKFSDFEGIKTGKFRCVGQKLFSLVLCNS